MAESTKINLDLDSLEREDVAGLPDVTEPYAVTFEGRRLEFADPSTLPYETLMLMDSHPSRFFRATLSDDDYAHFTKHSRKLVGYKLRALMTGYQTHYGVDELGNVVNSRR